MTYPMESRKIYINILLNVNKSVYVYELVFYAHFVFDW
jgi:hypothetical protein